ncbi:MAG: hypothetical protein R2818_14005 [Flavobacteriales bacterium]
MGTGNGTYAWSGPNNFNSTERTDHRRSIYTLVVTGANGCTSRPRQKYLGQHAAGASAGGVLNVNA